VFVLEPDATVKLAEAVHDPDASMREMALEVLPQSATAIAIDDVVKALTDPVQAVRNRRDPRAGPDRAGTRGDN